MTELTTLWQIARGRLYLRLPMLALPLGLLRPGQAKIDRLGTDGARLLLSPAWLERGCREDPDGVSALLLHTVLHCMLGHPWGRGQRDPARWSLACDLAAAFLGAKLLETPLPEALLGPRYACPPGAAYRAEALYDWLSGPEAPDPDTLAAACRGDDHSPWDRAEQCEVRSRLSGEGDGLSALWQQQEQLLRGAMQEKPPSIGSGTAGAKLTLQELQEEDHPFAAVLRRFAEVRENRRVDDADFSYAWYFHGLETCGLPLIEPLEYCEERKLRELVIVLDTSASCSRGLCARFLGLVCHLLRREDLFFTRFNLHILQCDCAVHQDTKLTTLEEFTDYIDHLELYGGGGTDFRPAFRHIDRLVAKGELTHLRGILYFTDGYGIFPETPPAYAAVFVMLRYRCDDIDLPRWAEKLLLDAEPPKGDEAWI